MALLQYLVFFGSGAKDERVHQYKAIDDPSSHEQRKEIPVVAE